MNSEFYLQIIGMAVLITVFTALVVYVAVWFFMVVYDFTTSWNREIR